MLLFAALLAGQTPAAAQSDDCEPETDLLERLLGYVWDLYNWTVTPDAPDEPASSGQDTVAIAPVSPPEREPPVSVKSEEPEEPDPLPPPRYDPIAMDTCAKKVVAYTGDADNLTRELGCKTQHPCAMRSIFDRVAARKEIDPSFLYALKWRESRWRQWNNDALTVVKVSRTNDWGVGQINKDSFAINFAERFDWKQVVEDPYYNTTVAAEILSSSKSGGFPGCYQYAESRLQDHLAIRELLSQLLERGAEVSSVDDLPEDLPAPDLTYQGQLELADLLDKSPDHWEAQVALRPHGPGYSASDVSEAAYACYNGGPKHWRRPWYTRTRYKKHVELFREDLAVFSNLDQRVWDDDYIDTLTGSTDQDLKKLLLGLRACTDREAALSMEAP